MEQEYYTLVTDTGLAKESNAHVEGQPKVQLLQMAVGDGLGENYAPSSDMTTLKHEVYRTNLNTLYVDPKHPKQLIIEAIIPYEVGGFTIREVGIFDSDGDLFAIGNYPETLKPQLTSGVSKDLYIRMILAFSDTPEVELVVDPNVVLVSMDDVRRVAKDIKHELEDHTLDIHVHNGGFQAILETQTVGPVGLHNHHFDVVINDYGTIKGESPFASENVPLICSDLARGDGVYDYGDLTT